MDDNIFSLHQGGKAANDEERLPQNEYVITDCDGDEYYGNGFVIFTTHHVAIMKDDGKGAIPVIVIPLGRVKACEAVVESEPELPFD
jgi:hypothetical protein